MHIYKNLETLNLSLDLLEILLNKMAISHVSVKWKMSFFLSLFHMYTVNS